MLTLFDRGFRLDDVQTQLVARDIHFVTSNASQQWHAYVVGDSCFVHGIFISALPWWRKTGESSTLLDVQSSLTINGLRSVKLYAKVNEQLKFPCAKVSTTVDKVSAL